MQSSKRHSPFGGISCNGSIRFAALAFAVFLVAQHLTELFVAQPIYPVTHYGKANDFRVLHDIVRAVWEGDRLNLGAVHTDPLNSGGGFYKPPFFALLISPLALLPFDTADIIFRLLTLLLVISVVAAAARHFKAGFWTLLTLMTAVLISHPGSFLLDRGNVDGLSQGLSFFSLWLLNAGAFFPAALLFAVACHLKSNVVAFLPALLLSGSLKTAFQRALAIGALLLLLAALTPEWSLTWFEVLRKRSSWHVLGWENGSIFRAFLWTGNPELCGSVVLAVSLAVMGGGLVWRTRQAAPPSPIALFLYLLPYCAAYPTMAYLYTHVFLPLLLLLYCPIVDRCESRFARCTALAGIAGTVLSCAPVAFLWNSPLHSKALAVVPALGLLLCLTANSILALPLWDTPLPESQPADTAGRRLSHRLAVLAVLSFFATAAYSIAGYLRRDPAILWFPESYTTPAGAQYPDLPLRIRNPRQGWGRMRVNANLYGQRLSVAGVQYEHGISTHAASDIEVLFSGRFSRLSGRYGIDDSQEGRSPRLVFMIVTEDRVLFRSPPIAPGTPAQSFSADITGLDSVHLRVQSLSPAAGWSQADWLELKVE